jgi:uncharacterized membrane protein
MEHFNVDLLLRWIHFLSGITWIGLLYYFNLVQVPALAVAAKDQGGPGPAGITKYVAPRALWWFRWGAVVTWLSGAAILLHRGLFLDAFTLGQRMETPNVYVVGIGMGAWLGTIMLFNVWGLIWRNQKKVLGIVAATDEEKNKARRVAFLASRTNVMLSIGMLLFMGAAHGILFR